MTKHYEITKKIHKVQRGKGQCNDVVFCMYAHCDKVRVYGDWYDYKILRRYRKDLSSGLCEEHFNKIMESFRRERE